MLLLTDLITEYQEATKDITATNKTRGIRRMNQWQRMVNAQNQNFFLRKTKIIPSVASQQEYKLPNDCTKVYSVKINTNDTWIVAQEIPGMDEFDRINVRETAVTSDYMAYWHVREGKLYIYPTAATSALDISIVYEKRYRDMKIENYTTGTIAVTLGSTAVTGTTTAWDATYPTVNILPGSYILINDIPYEIESVTSTTALVLSKPYEGTTQSGLGYTIGDTPIVPEQFGDIVWLAAAKDYYRKKESPTNNIYFRDYNEIWDVLKAYGLSDTNNNVSYIKNTRRAINPNSYPRSIG